MRTQMCLSACVRTRIIRGQRVAMTKPSISIAPPLRAGSRTQRKGNADRDVRCRLTTKPKVCDNALAGETSCSSAALSNHNDGQ